MALDGLARYFRSQDFEVIDVNLGDKMKAWSYTSHQCLAMIRVLRADPQSFTFIEVGAGGAMGVPTHPAPGVI